MRVALRSGMIDKLGKAVWAAVGYTTHREQMGKPELGLPSTTHTKHTKTASERLAERHGLNSGGSSNIFGASDPKSVGLTSTK